MKTNELNLDLVFLDSYMPEPKSFNKLSQIESNQFEVIVIKSQNQSITALKQGYSYRYIINPIDIDALQVSLKHAQINIEQPSMGKKNKHLLQQTPKESNIIVIPTQKGLNFFKPEEITRLEGTDGYTTIHLKNEKMLMSSYNIGKFNKIFMNHGFIQVHKSHLINTNYLKSYNNEGIIELQNGDKVPLSKTRKKDFLNNL